MKNIPMILMNLNMQYSFDRKIAKGLLNYSLDCGPWFFFDISLQNASPGGLKYQESTNPEVSSIPNKASGLVLIDSKENDYLLKLNIPTIKVIGYQQTTPETPCIFTEPKKIASVAAAHLLEKKVRHFAYCGVPYYWSMCLGKEYKKLINEEGFDVHIYQTSHDENGQLYANEITMLIQWLQKLPKPVAIFACNDFRATHIAHSCQIAEISIPEEILLLGSDNDDHLCNSLQPPLSSIYLDMEPAGYRAGEVLNKMIKGKQLRKSDMIIEGNPSHVVVRHSTDLMSVSDPEVAQAIKYLNEHLTEALQVDDVVNATTIGRRRLEQRFMKILGRSIYNEIKRMRIKKIESFLRDTSMSITEIAKAMSFSQPANLPRYFKEETGITPSEYRNSHIKQKTV